MATITDRYNSVAHFTTLLTTLGLNQQERDRITDDGFNTMKALVDHYKTRGPKEVHKYLKDHNKTFGNASAANRRVYYSPVKMNRIVGTAFYFILSVHALHTIPDIALIDAEMASQLGDTYDEFIGATAANDDDDPVDINIPVLKGSSNWVEWKEKLHLKLAHLSSKRGFPLAYVIDTTARPVRRGNAALVESPTVDFSDLDIFKTQATHFGPAFNDDNKKVWSVIESNLVNTMPYNHIAQFSNSKNGRNAYEALRVFYEGEDFVQRQQQDAMRTITNTYFRGDTKNFKFENYVNAHVNAHKKLLDIGYNNNAGMDDATKIHHFKTNIQPAADLENVLTLARTKEKGGFQAYVTYIATEHDFKQSRKRQVAQSTRERNVSKVGNNGNNDNKNKNKGGGQMLSETVDGLKVFSKSYPRHEFSKLTPNQRSAVVCLNAQKRANRQRNNNNNNNPGHNHNDNNPGRNVSGVQLEDLVTLGDAIVAGVKRGSTETGDDVTAMTPASGAQSGTSKASAQAGSVGDFLSKKRSKQSDKK